MQIGDKPSLALRQGGWIPKRREAKVTIAIGLISKLPKTRHSTLENVIVMASDSQSTFGAAKRVNQNKLSEIKFKNGSVLVAQAGIVELGDAITQRMEAIAAEKELTDYRTAAEVAQQALIELRTHLMKINEGAITDWERFFWECHRLDLLVGCFFNGKPYLYKLDLWRASPTAVNQFESIGGGKDLGHTLLNEYRQVDPDFMFGEIVAGAVIDKVIDNVDGCGHPIWIGFAHPSMSRNEQSWTYIYDSSISEEIVKKFKEQEEQLLIDRREKLIKTVQSVWGDMQDDDEIQAYREKLGIVSNKSDT